MKDHQQLAIVIPAYKKKFFEQALQSIVNQTSRLFTLYIGDDQSPEDLYSIVKKYQAIIPIVYHRFEENWGGKNLVSHWERCIALTKEEDWIWLFSDDDIMEPNCVETLYKNVNRYTKEHLFHFDVKVINEKNEMVREYQPFPQHLTVEDFFAQKMRHQLSSFVIEYIFSRETYERCRGFEKFDLAWSSDDATWIKFAANTGIITLPDAFVQWRYSGLNLSSITEDKNILLRKIRASEAYLKWAAAFFSQHKKRDNTTSFEKAKWILDQFIHSKALTLKEKWRCIREVLIELGYQGTELKIGTYLMYTTIKKRWLGR